MNVDVARVAESNNVIPFLERSIANQREQLGQSEMILAHIKGIEANVNAKAAEVEQIKSDIQLLAKEIHDENRLLPAEIDDLYHAVVDRSITLAKHEHSEEEENFSRVVGRIRRRMWSEMKKRFGTSKYIHIKRKDFGSALNFVASFRMSDYV